MKLFKSMTIFLTAMLSINAAKASLVIALDLSGSKKLSGTQKYLNIGLDKQIKKLVDQKKIKGQYWFDIKTIKIPHITLLVIYDESKIKEVKKIISQSIKQFPKQYKVTLKEKAKPLGGPSDYGKLGWRTHFWVGQNAKIDNENQLKELLEKIEKKLKKESKKWNKVGGKTYSLKSLKKAHNSQVSFETMFDSNHKDTLKKQYKQKHKKTMPQQKLIDEKIKWANIMKKEMQNKKKKTKAFLDGVRGQKNLTGHLMLMQTHKGDIVKVIKKY